MSEQVGSVTCEQSSDFHGRIRFQSRFTIRWELEDKNFLKVDIICLDDSVHVKYRIVAIKTTPPPTHTHTGFTLIGALARKEKHLDATTMFTYSHATPLGKSERAYYLSYFINFIVNHVVFM